MTMRVAPPAAAKTMRAVIFTALITGQRAKHENELRKMGFEVDTRDFPKTYKLDAYDIVFIVKDHAFDSDKTAAEQAAKVAGKHWMRLTKKVSNPTWEAVRDFARRHGLAPVPDINSHEPTFAARSFASALAEHIEKKSDADDWQELAEEYEQAAQIATKKAADALAKYETAESELREVRKRLQHSAEDANAAAAQREAVKRELALTQGTVEKLKKAEEAARTELLAAARDRNEARIARDKLQIDRARLQEELKTARDELRALRAGEEGGGAEIEELRKKINSVTTMLTRARGERDDAQRIVKGLQDEIERLARELGTAKRDGGRLTAPAGKKLIRADIAATVEKVWSLVGDGVLDADEAIEKIIVQLKGD